MALFEDEPLEDLEEDEVNSYLRDPEKGLELVRSILRWRRRQPVGSQVGRLGNIPTLLAGLELDHEAEFYQRLSRLGSRMEEQDKVSLLDGKVVLGVGGRFSAGKSCFINSITNAQLPEEQRETTSISTYVIHAPDEQNVALTTGGGSILLNDKAVQALTHQFFEAYHIGFSRVIQNLAICSPKFRYDNIAILDTPGYNKADTGRLKEVTDAENARQQLSGVDYLIWLVDIENGELKADDEKFIDDLNVHKQQILIVCNKAGTVSKTKAQAVVDNIKSRLENSGKKFYNVIAYDSRDGETIVGEDTLEKFLNMVNTDRQRSRNLKEQLDELKQDISQDIHKQLKILQKQQNVIDRALTDSTDAKGLGALIAAYTSCNRRQRLLNSVEDSLRIAFLNLKVRQGGRANG